MSSPLAVKVEIGILCRAAPQLLQGALLVN